MSRQCLYQEKHAYGSGNVFTKKKQPAAISVGRVSIMSTAGI